MAEPNKEYWRARADVMLRILGEIGLDLCLKRPDRG
jgi:hypothetical protein